MPTPFSMTRNRHQAKERRARESRRTLFSLSAVRRTTLLFPLLILVGCEDDPPTKVQSFSWQAVGGDMATQTVQVLQSDPAHAGTLYAGTLEGVFKSLDGGKTWLAASQGLSNKDITALAVSPSQSNRLYCGTWGKGVFTSSDGGQNWQSCWSVGQNPLINDLLLQPTGSGLAVWAATAQGLYRSVDEGKTWKPVGAFGFIYVVDLLSNDGQKMLISIQGFGIYRSLDGGNRWSEANNGIPTDSYGQEAVKVFCTDPLDPKICFAITDRDKFYRSLNSGDSWQELGIGHYYVPERSGLCYATDSADPLWLAARFAGVYKSSDKGSAWIKLNSGLENIEIKSILVTHAQKTVACVGTVGKGIYRYEE